MSVNVYRLQDPNVKDYYMQSIDMNNCLSVTLTLNPIMYSADILSQYREAIAELKQSKIFYYKTKNEYKIHPDFEEFIIVPELTKEMNIHFHGYFKCNPEKNAYFQNEFKKFTYKNKVFGRQHTFKLIDNLTDTLKEYPFKDISEMLKFPDSSKIYIIKFGSGEII